MEGAQPPPSSLDPSHTVPPLHLWRLILMSLELSPHFQIASDAPALNGKLLLH